ncbi:MAG: hypothetical protein HQ477_06700 [Chloroflexi bacterium]|nr:hypothetical protein [Chloroflexota bacterium]
MNNSHRMSDHLLETPQLTTGARLLRLGEEMEFHFYLPKDVESGSFAIFPRYLERSGASDEFQIGEGLDWLLSQTPDSFELNPIDGRAFFKHQPMSVGNYIARWDVGDEALHRYFAVIEDDSIVLRFSSFIELESEPSLHSTGIPLDYRLPTEQFERHSEPFDTLLSYHRMYGDSVIPAFADTPPDGETENMTTNDRVSFYSDVLENVRALLPDSSDARSARVEMHHPIDPGYVEVFEQLGLNDHFGLQESNILPWLGMPEFPYFASPNDFRKTNQNHHGEVISHTWDFCAGFHFIGPISWHYAASEGDFASAANCIRQGMDELKNMAELSGYPAFANPLYDGATKNYGYPNGVFNEGYGDEPILEFVDSWQRLIAFEFTSEYKLVFARSIDIADYYRRHFAVTPRSVFSSKTDHAMYDIWWNCAWGRNQTITTRDRLPWSTRMSSIMQERRSHKTVTYTNLVSGSEVTRSAITKDPISTEHLLIEDQHRSIRFERESPNPIWWFDYSEQERGDKGSEIGHTETPDVDVIRSERSDKNGITIKLKMVTDAVFKQYAIALWGVPTKFSLDRSRIKTNATDFVLAKNVDNEFHIVLFFDLEPDTELSLTVIQE